MSNLDTLRQQKPEGTCSLMAFLSSDGWRNDSESTYKTYGTGNSFRMSLHRGSGLPPLVDGTVGEMIVQCVFTLKTVKTVGTDMCLVGGFLSFLRETGQIPDECLMVRVVVVVR